MRGNATTLIIFIVALVVLVLYILIGSAQIGRMNRNAENENKDLQAQIDQIRAKEDAIPQLKRNLVTWRRQLGLFGTAIPPTIEDEKFLISLIQEMDNNDVTLLGLDTTKSGTWLGEIDEKKRLELEEMQIDPDMAAKIKVADVTLKLLGEFGNILNVFESLKRYERLYAIQMVAGPAAGGAGTIAQTVDPNNTPIAITGRLFYGLPASEVDRDELDRIFLEAVAGPAARQVFNGIKQESKDLTGGTNTTDADGENAGSEEDAPGDGDLALAGRHLAVLTPGTEGWLR